MILSFSVIFISIVNKGISNHLLKASAKRRRSKAQIKEEKAQEERKQKEIAKKLATYDAMEQKIMEQDTLIEEKDQYRLLCASLYDEGVIKQSEDVSIIPVEDPLEREGIRTKSK